MKKRGNIIFFVVAIVGFLSLNTYLIVTEKEKIARTVYVNDWTTVKKGDIIENFETNGVIVPREEAQVFYDKTEKDFLRFLVQEGDVIEPGTPLFEYANPNLDKEKRMLEVEIQQLEGQIDEIENYITALSTQQQASIPVSQEVDESWEDYMHIANHVSTTFINQSIQQEMNEQELELSKLEEKLEAYELQLNYLHEEENFVTIVSETDGIVAEINEDLMNPIVTIASSEYVVEGMLKEEQVERADTGMKIITISEEPLKGHIEKINPYPEQEPSLETESTYRFHANLEGADSFIIGTKVNLSVITNEAIGVPTVPEEVIQDDIVYLLDANGKIIKQTITPGLSVQGVQEIKAGVEFGDIVASEIIPDVGANTNFVTTLKLKDVQPSLLKYVPKEDRWKYFWMGF